jgi:hypothetical protein
VCFKGSRRIVLRAKDHSGANISILKQNRIDSMKMLSVNRKVLEAKIVVFSSSRLRPG